MDAKPNHGDLRVTINYGQRGQARAYADSHYTARMTIEEWAHDGSGWKPRKLNDDVAKPYSQLVEKWTQEGNKKLDGSPADWHSPTLTKFSRVSDGVWDVCVTRTYIG